MLFDACQEFDRQVANLDERGYAAAAQLSPGAFQAALRPLRTLAEDVALGPDSSASAAPFVVVVRAALVPPRLAMEMTRLGHKVGFSDLRPREHAEFAPIDSVAVPSGPAYLACGLETGTEYLNVTPEAALKAIVARGRSPLTIEEGIALVTQFPQLLRKKACFSMPGSRAGDQRVPAIWISAGRPKLGWCWDRNPHTWLGSASCTSRIGSV